MNGEVDYFLNVTHEYNLFYNSFYNGNKYFYFADPVIYNVFGFIMPRFEGIHFSIFRYALLDR